MGKVAWNGAEPVGGIAAVLYGLRTADADGLLTDPATMLDIAREPGMDAVPLLDALVVQVNRMSVAMDRLKTVMNAAAPEAQTVMDVTIGDPVRQKGTMLVPVLFALADGQSVTVWFHNPDSSPNKITPMDDLVSWKWVLNRQDITIAVAPERGKDLNIREVGRRIMKLAAKNAPAFAKANAKAAERAQEESELDAEISSLTGELAELGQKLDVARQAKEDRANNPAPAPAPTPAPADGPMQITDPRNYAPILAGDHSLAITYQDQLDEYFAGRLEEVRSALVSLGWAGERFNSLAKNGYKLETSLYTASARRFVVGVTWNVRGSVDDPIFSYTDDLTLSATEIAARLDASAPAAAPVKPVGITSPEGYAKIIAGDKALAEANQDELDSFFGARLVDTRNALRALGWDGPRFQELKKEGATLNYDLNQVGGGSNIVGVTWYIGGWAQRVGQIVDDLTKTPEEIAKHLDDALAQAQAEEAAERANRRDPADVARELQEHLDERAPEIFASLIESGFEKRPGDYGTLLRGGVMVSRAYGSAATQKAMGIEITAKSEYSVKSFDGSRAGMVIVVDTGSDPVRDVVREIREAAAQIQKNIDDQAAKAASEANPLALKDGEGELLVTDVAGRANHIIELLIAKGFTVSSASEGVFTHDLIAPHSEGVFTVGLDASYPEWMEFIFEASYDYVTPNPKTQSDAEIAEKIAAIDWNTAFANVSDSGEVEDSFAGAGPLHGKPLAFARTAMMVEAGAAKAGMNVHYGDFSGSTSGSLLDGVTGQESVIGITAQIHADGVIYARLAIDESATASLLRGASGSDSLGNPATAAEVAALLGTVKAEQKAVAKAKADAEKPARVLVGDVRRAYDSIGYVINDLRGHTSAEFARANTNYLKAKIAEAEELIKRGLPKRGTIPDLAGMIQRGYAIDREVSAAAAQAAAAAKAEEDAAAQAGQGSIPGAANDATGPLTDDDMALIASIHDGSADVTASDMVKRLEGMATRAAGTAMQSVVDEAVAAYSVAVVAKSAERIATLTRVK